MKESLSKTALIISFGTLLSKFGGLARQLVIAGAFGISAAYDAYNYAYVIPGFFLILIGGINGPLHNAVVTVLSKTNNKESAYIINSINLSITFLLLFAGGFLFLFSDPLIKLIAPGLEQEVHNIAVVQLKIMSPIIPLSGLIGIGFGSLNAKNTFFITTISPIISSFTVICGVGLFWLTKESFVDTDPIQLAIKGGVIIAQATLIGAFTQWVVQIPSLIKKDLFRFNLKIDLKHPGVKEIWGVLTPATLSSGMLQINVITDLFFASSIAGAAAGLGYANFLVQTPLGIISSGLILPLLPVLSKLANKNDQKKFINKVRQGLIISSGTMIALGSIFITLGPSIVNIIYGRGAFDSRAIDVVGGLLIIYGVGMPAYLCRDLLVRVFYTLGDAVVPLRISIIGIVLNIILDWLLIGSSLPFGLINPINFGARGLVLATIGVNIFSCVILLLKLNNKLSRTIPIKQWAIDFCKLLVCGIISGIIALKTNDTMSIYLGNNIIIQLLKIIIPSLTGIIGFLVSGRILNIQEMNKVLNIIKGILISS